MILTLTINPAIDRTVSVDRLVFEDRGYILARGEAAGGRGINASQMISAFGGKTRALLTAGGATGEKLTQLLTALGLPFEAVRVRAESRVNLTISDKQGLTVKLNEVGAPLEPAEVDAVRKLVESRLDKVGWLMICGSLQPGAPRDFYAEIIGLAKQRGVRTLLDTDGDALLQALEAKPTVISPNQSEAERLLGRAIITRAQCLEALERIHGMGPESVVLSLGARGALLACRDGVFEALPPRVDALSPIGAGDALAAAYTWSLDKKKSHAEALRWAVAAGTATAMLPGMTFPTFDQTRAVYKQVQVKSLR